MENRPSLQLSRRSLLAAGASGVAVLTLASAGHPQTQTLASVSDAVKALHSRLIVIDPHLDVPFDYGTGNHDPKVDGDTQFDLPKARRGGLAAATLAAFVPTGPITPDGFTKAGQQLDAKLDIIHAIADTNPDQAEIALTPDDVLRIHKAGKLAIIVSFLNAYSLGEDLTKIDAVYRRGVRIFGLVWAGNNQFADSSRPSADPGPTNNGLSPLGRDAVKRLNDLGILVDVSQLSKPGVLQSIALSRAPVIATHSGVWGIAAHPRNLSDEELDALKAKKGVIAINAFTAYLKPIPSSSSDQVRAIRAQFGLPESYSYPLEGWAVLPQKTRADFSHAINALLTPATVSDLVDSIDYAVKRIGIDHVAISSDFNHGGGVIGWNNEGEAINVTAELVKRGYSEANIGKLWGGNVLRVWRTAQSAARP